MFHRRRRIQYYRGPAHAEKLTQKIWFPFAAVALAALVFGLILGLILSSVASHSRLERLPKRELKELGFVEKPSEKYAPLLDVEAIFVDPSDMSQSELKKAVASGDGNATCVLLFDGVPYYDSQLEIGYESEGALEAKTIAKCADDKSLYGMGGFVSSAFSEKEAVARTYEKGRELALLSELVSAGFDEILIFGLPSDATLVNEVSLFLAEVKELSPKTRLCVVVKGGASDEEIARLVAATEVSADSFALDLREMEIEKAADTIERNAYFLTQYHMRLLVEKNTDVAEAYGLKSWILWEKE